MLPKSFKIANTVINVNFTDVPSTRYGYFCDAKREIIINKNLIVTDNDKEEIVELDDEQILNTFWHEVFHAFQMFLNNEIDETQAQVYANFMREYESTKCYDEISNQI
jgi:hypothetical protein